MKLLPILAVAARESSKEPDPRSESYPRDLAQFRQEEKREQFRALISGDLQCIPEVFSKKEVSPEAPFLEFFFSM